MGIEKSPFVSYNNKNENHKTWFKNKSVEIVSVVYKKQYFNCFKIIFLLLFLKKSIAILLN